MAREGLAEPPVRWNDVGKDEGLTISGHDTERERLAVEVTVGLPVCSPVSGH